MITEAIVKMLAALVRGVVGALPSTNPPEWFLNAGSQWSLLMDQASALSYWLPVSLGVRVAGAILACIAIGFVIKVARIILSFATLGGGSAA